MTSLGNTIISDRNIHNLVEIYLRNKNNLPNDLKNIPIGDWNVTNVTDMSNLFADTIESLEEFNEPLNGWDVSNVTNMKMMFQDCTDFNQPLNNWNVSKVTNMAQMFHNCKVFNQPLDNWDVSKVTEMDYMFSYCLQFNQPLNSWNTSSLINVQCMFESCLSFNQPLNKWNVSNVKDMIYMFAECKIFNQSLNDWDVSNVTEMFCMFRDCNAFNQPLNNWNVSNVVGMSEMFNNCYNFNQSLNNWDVSNVRETGYMFNNCKMFNQPLNNWNVSNVTIMNYMFTDCKNFNQPLNNWDVSNVTEMDYMFNGCENFNQPLNNWNVRNVIEMEDIFQDCPIEEQNKPRFRQVPPALPIIDPNEIHREAAKINYAKLNEFLKEKIDMPFPSTNINFPVYINTNLLQIIDENDEPEETKTLQKNGLQRIMRERLYGLNYSEFSVLLRNSIFYIIEYVLQQPPEFQKKYIEMFIKDCVYAHADEGEDGMTCAAGALERLPMSLVNACGHCASIGIEIEDCEKIVAIIVANPEKLIPEYIQDWYKLHKTGTHGAFPSNTSVLQKKASLKNYLLNKFPNEGSLIDLKIAEIADNIGYDDDDFMYGGRKRKNANRINTKKKIIAKKTRKIRKIKLKTKKTKKLRNIIKIRKTKKYKK